MEANLVTLLKTLCPRVHPDIAPEDTQTPYVTWQGIGGAPSRMLDKTAGDKRNTLMQINVWSESRLESLNLIRDIEDAMCASGAFLAVPVGEPLSMYEEDPQLYGCVQRYSIWASR